MSILITEQVTNTQGGIQDSYEFGIKQENMAYIAHFLRNQCYKDPIRAVLREYATNANDVHTQQGVTRPFQVTLPSTLDSFFKVRDFGAALSNEDIGNIYCSYGASTKRNDAAQTGMLGLGSKSGFAYGDSFLVNCYRDGKIHTWNAYIDPSLKGKIDLMNVEDTNEPDGLEIVIPVKDEDIYEFRSKAIEMVLPYFENVLITNIEPDEQTELDRFKARKPVFDGQNWKYFGTGDSVAIMGNVPYPIDVDAFTDQELTEDLQKFARMGLILSFKNGDLTFAISRESLQYTADTKKNIISKIQEIVADLTKQAEAKFNGCTSLWDSIILWKDIFRVDGSLYPVKHLFERRLKFNNFPVYSGKFQNYNYESFQIARYETGGKYGGCKIKKLPTQEIEADVKNTVVVNDTGICNGIVNRVVALLANDPSTGAAPPYDKVYVITLCDDHTEYNKWKQETGFDFVPKSLKDLPKYPISKYFPSLNRSGSVGFANIKHMSQEFSFLDGYGRTNSNYWQQESVDLNNAQGVYVELERFEYLGRKGNYKPSSRLRDLLTVIKSVGIVLPDKIYGFKKKSASKAAANPNMITFWTWLDEAVAEYIKANPKIEQDFVNRNYVNDKLTYVHAGLKEMGDQILAWPIIKDFPEIVSFFDKVNQLHSYDDTNLENITKLLHYTKYQLQDAPVFDIRDEYHALENRYPLLFKACKQTGHHILGPDGWATHLQDYMILIDMATPQTPVIGMGQPAIMAAP